MPPRKKRKKKPVVFTQKEQDGMRKWVRYIKKIPKIVDGMDLQTRLFLESRREMIEKHHNVLAFIECENLKNGLFSFLMQESLHHTDVTQSTTEAWFYIVMCSIPRHCWGKDDCYNQIFLPIKSFYEMLHVQKKESWKRIIEYFDMAYMNGIFYAVSKYDLNGHELNKELAQSICQMLGITLDEYVAAYRFHLVVELIKHCRQKYDF